MRSLVKGEKNLVLSLSAAYFFMHETMKMTGGPKQIEVLVFSVVSVKKGRR